LFLVTKKQEAPLSPKSTAILARIRKLVALNEPVVVYSEWTEYIERLRENLDLAGISSSFLHGGLSVRQRKEQIDLFCSKTTKVFFSSDAGGTGIDGLQFVARQIIHTEHPFNPARISQRVGRLNRLGQTQPVESTIFISDESIEQTIFSSAQEKANIRNEVLYKSQD
jgi:SNF2 family DNA or RNA helicase